MVIPSGSPSLSLHVDFQAFLLDLLNFEKLSEGFLLILFFFYSAISDVIECQLWSTSA